MKILQAGAEKVLTHFSSALGKMPAVVEVKSSKQKRWHLGVAVLALGPTIQNSARGDEYFTFGAVVIAETESEIPRLADAAAAYIADRPETLNS